MKIVRAAAVAVAMTILVLVPAAGGSGFHPPMASFTSRYEPGLLLDQFAAGRLGLIEPSWETTYLYVAYRYLAGPGFDADEQKVLLSFWNAKPDFQPHLGPESDWLVARSKIPGAADIRTLDLFARGPGYTFFRNCDDDAFLTATTTLQSMVAKFGASGPQVRQWLDAQDLVFQNCPGSKQNPHIPQPPPGGTAFEQAERAYQIACANFYGERFDEAARMFAAIAADPTSPWRAIAPYLVARAMIRNATLSGVNNDNALLAQAETQLKAIAAGSGPDDLKAAVQRLLGFVGCRLHPHERHEEEVRAIMRPGSERTLQQDLKDYLECGSPREDTQGDLYADDLDDWIATFSNAAYPPNIDTEMHTHAVDKWQRTGSLAWLVASLAEVPASDPEAEALIKAAQSVGSNSPAYLTAAFELARILVARGRTDEARTELDAILANRDAVPRSAVNRLSWLRLKFVRNLDEFLRYAQRYPVKIVGDAPLNFFTDPHWQRVTAGPLLDVDGAEVLDRWLPLSVLRQAARSQILPPPLRARVAVSVWVRSILLGDRQTALALAPAVSDLLPDLKPSLDAWLAAKTRDEQRFEAAFIMLLNPGMRPYVDPGFLSAAPLGGMEFLTNNWWPAFKSVAFPSPQAPGRRLRKRPSPAIRASCPPARGKQLIANG
jgi:hypothetical protein